MGSNTNDIKRGGRIMIDVKCKNEKCENYDVLISLPLPNDALVYCGPCGSLLNGTPPVSENDAP